MAYFDQFGRIQKYVPLFDTRMLTEYENYIFLQRQTRVGARPRDGSRKGGDYVYFISQTFNIHI